VGEGTVEVNGVQYVYLDDGPADGPLALCLHGFPDSAHTWRHLLPVLAAAGFHAVAPFLRGYAPTGLAPDGVYQTGAFAADAAALHEQLGGRDDAVLIGHDWGALATYAAVAHEPARWRRAVTAAVPPVPSVANTFFTYGQLKRSWYTFFFQSPLAEVALPLDDYAFFDRLWADWSPRYDATWDIARVKESIGHPDRILAAISPYRAMYDPGQRDAALAAWEDAAMVPTPVPTLYLHGADDGCFAVEAIGDPLAHLAEGSELVTVDRAGHFLHLEQPEQVNRHVLRFLGS
jgi:pimeloyl-ACP methyl ester carboxylesterase